MSDHNITVDFGDLAERIAERTAEIVLAKIASKIEAAQTSAQTGLLTKRGIALAIGVSIATIDRLDREGAPHERVGASKKYDLGRYRAWLAVRGSKPTTKASSDARIDAPTETLLERRGLRVVGGGR